MSTKDAFPQARGQLSMEANMPFYSRAHLRLKSNDYTQTKEKQAAESRSSHAGITKQSHVTLPRNLRSTSPADSQNVRRFTENNHVSLSSAAEEKALPSFIRSTRSSEKKALPSFMKSPHSSLSRFPTSSSNLTFSFVSSASKQNADALHRSTLDQKVVALESISKAAATHCAHSCYLLGNCEPTWKCGLVALGAILAAMIFLTLAVIWYMDLWPKPRDTWFSNTRDRIHLASKNKYYEITERQQMKEFKNQLKHNDDVILSSDFSDTSMDLSSDDSNVYPTLTSIGMSSDESDSHSKPKKSTPNLSSQSKTGGRKSTRNLLTAKK